MKNKIDELSKLKTTQQIIDWYRKYYPTTFQSRIREDMLTCERGNREAIEDVIGKKVVPVDLFDTEFVENVDVINELKVE